MKTDTQRSYPIDELIQFVLKWHKLSQKAVRNLEQILKNSPDDLESRAKLIGFYFTRYHFSKHYCGRRKQHIMWMIKNIPNHPFTMESFWIVLKTVEPRTYKVIKKLWLDRIRANPDSWQILVNAAGALYLSDLAAAKVFAWRAKKLNPNNNRVKKVIASISNLEKFKKRLSSYAPS